MGLFVVNETRYNAVVATAMLPLLPRLCCRLLEYAVVAAATIVIQSRRIVYEQPFLTIGFSCALLVIHRQYLDSHVVDSNLDLDFRGGHGNTLLMVRRLDEHRAHIDQQRQGPHGTSSTDGSYQRQLA